MTVLKPLEQRSLLFALIAIIICALSGGTPSALSALAGSSLMLMSLLFWRYAITQFLSGQNSSKILVFFLSLLKMAGMTWAIWYLIIKISIEPLAFLIGLSSIVASLFFSMFQSQGTKES
ncbi:MAG: hypothetical protein A3I05_02770 [Deltaproteobacteria bacterium RIFCSPLOWO2_02_FULL_44_10]|nr:MAG: hypothetical protein A3C46_03435 [Deltaproteobacteria bacterium RIFCSPHIGHO2_02_FULL_44_16]OGQ46540.1 MAG: hypothetical protein A3I05_02770 [Deltaproteobacteria bacterium RIFCSPLOWO2_02_FULL_44_10]